MGHDKPSDEERASQRSRRRVRLLVIYPLLALGLVIGLSVGWMSLRNAAAHKAVDQIIGRMRSQNEPYDDASLATYYEQHSSTQDLDKWLSILSAVVSDDFVASSKTLYPWNGSEAPVPGADWPEHAQAQALLDQSRELIEVASPLARADIKRRMPINFDGVFTQLDWAEKVRQLGRLFQLQAAEAIYRRDSNETREAILNILGTARSTEGQPLIVAQLVTMAVEALALEQLQHALEHDCLNADDLKLLQNRLNARSAWHDIWKLGITGERGMMLPAFKEPERYMAQDMRAKLPWRGRDQLTYLTISENALKLPSEDLNSFHQAIEELESSLDAKFRQANWMAQFDNFLCNFLLPAYGAFGEAVVQRDMRYRLALLAIAVRQYQDQFGMMPNSLEDLKKVGIDLSQLSPIGDKPFGFRKQDDGVLLWGFPSRQIDSTPDEPPDLSETNNAWDRMWLWKINM